MKNKILVVLVAALSLSVLGFVGSENGFPEVCNIPKSLLLHPDYGYLQAEKLATEIIERDLRTLTYENLYQMYWAGKCPPENTIIVSLDDISTSYISKSEKRMIEAFLDKGLVITVGVVTKKYSTQEAWDYLNKIQQRGVEIASHTVTHPDLGLLRLTSYKEELNLSFDLICKNTERCPKTLILPYGAGRVFASENPESYINIVSVISANYVYEYSSGTVYVFGRAESKGDAKETLDWLDLAFPLSKNQNIINPKHIYK